MKSFCATAKPPTRAGALAEINCAAPLSQTLGELYPKPRQDGPLYALLDRLELRSVISRLGLSPGETAGAMRRRRIEARAAAAVNDLDAAKALLGGTDPVSALLEYSGKQPCRAALAGLSAAALFEAGAPGWDDFLGALSRCAAPLSLTDSKEWYRSRFLTDPDGQPTLAAFDPVLAGYLLSPLSSGYSLESLCAGRNLDPPALSLPEGISPEMSALAQRAAVLPALTAALSAELEEKGMKRLLEEIEIPLAPGARLDGSPRLLARRAGADRLRPRTGHRPRGADRADLLPRGRRIQHQLPKTARGGAL